MNISRNSVILIALAVIPAHVGAGDRRTLCDAAEDTYLSCLIGKKLLSVCGSNEITTESGYLRYLFGESGKRPELIYPTGQVHPSKAFRRNKPLVSAKTGAMVLAFDISGITYNVFSTRSAFGYNGAGVIVQQGEKEVVKECTYSTVDDDRFFFDLPKIGIPFGSVRFIGPEQ